MKKLLLVLTAFTLFAIGCRKDTITTDIDFVPENDETIETGLIGQVIDETGLPVADAMISISGMIKETNEDGIFRFDTIDLATNGELAIIEKDGFFTNFKRVIPSEEDTFVKFGLTHKTDPTGSFRANEGGIISRQGKEKITFEPNSIVDESGNSYSGEVTVFSDYFNADKDYLGEMMPGDLSGINQEGTKVQLETYSMVLVELFGENGEELNLKEGTTANIEFPVSQQTPNPPAEIALWSLNETTGLWVEEGIATFDGNTYQGEVSHFSFWNCDAPFPVVNLKGRFTGMEGEPMEYRKVNIAFVESGLLGTGYTNKNGVFSGKVPANRRLSLSLINTCDSVIYKQEVGPFSDDMDLSAISVDIIQNITQITGKVEGCNGEIVSQGFVTITDDLGRASLFDTEMDGSFDISYVNCGTTSYKIKGANTVQFTESIEKVYIDKGQASLNAGTLTTCDEIDEFYRIEIGGENSLLSDVGVFISAASSTAVISNWLFEQSIVGDKILIFMDNQIGEIFPRQISFVNSNSTNSLECNSVNPCEPYFSINLSQNDDFIGGYWIGTGTGQLWSDTQLVPVVLSFKAPVEIISTEVKGKLWHDTNKNGLQDAGELPFTSGTVHLNFINAGGDLQNIQSPVDTSGEYSLIAPGLGRFEVLIKDLPSDYSLTQQNVGNDDTIDSDFDPVSRSIENGQIIQASILEFDCGIIEN